MPTQLTKEQQIEIKRKSRYFIVIEGQLYKKNRKDLNRPFKVIKRNEVESILYYVHSDPLARHFAIEETYRRVKIRYYWP